MRELLLASPLISHKGHHGHKGQQRACPWCPSCPWWRFSAAIATEKGVRPLFASTASSKRGRTPFSADQQETHLWLFFAPMPSSSLIVSGNGLMRWTGPLAMSTVVLPSRFTPFTSAPLETR